MKKITLWMMYLGSAACLLSGCAKKRIGKNDRFNRREERGAPDGI